MGRKPSDDQQEEFLKYLNSGRDEMNLIEHSFASADTKVDLSGKPVVFVREDTEPGTGKPVKREWKMSFSGEYGRPTPRDDDVFVACMKLSAAMNFADRKVFFTRYEMCRILGWQPGGSNYPAIDAAFKRLNGVQVVANKYFWDNSAKKWVKKFFHIIDEVSLYELEEYGEEYAHGGKTAPRSWFVWSEVMQESFDAGYVRKLDLEVYRSLNNAIARKLYRYLGKQFWRSTTHGVELKKLCHEKLGYSQKEVRHKRLIDKISPAIAELEEKGIYGLSHEFKSSYGKCEVVFKASSKLKDKPKETKTSNPLVEKLVALGIKKSDATTAVQSLTPERIIEDIEHVEFEDKAGRVKSSKAGMLAKMLKADEPWPRPKGFVTSAMREANAKKSAEKKERLEKEAKAKEARDKQEHEQNLYAFNQFMGGLSEKERVAFEEKALQNRFLGKRYRDAVAEKDSKQISRCLHDALFFEWQTQVELQQGQAVNA